MQALPEPPLPNRPPVIVGNINQRQDATGTNEVTVTLDGSAAASDPDGDTLTFAWEQTAGLSVTLSSLTDPLVSFMIDATDGAALEFQLTISDGGSVTASALVPIIVPASNSPPIAKAGGDQQVKPGTIVTLNGGGSSDLNGNPLTFTWAQTAGSPVVLSGAATSQPSFTAPASAGTLTFVLTVSDGLLTATDEVVIVVSTIPNNPPVAAGISQSQTLTGTSEVTVTLDGSASFDPDGDTLTFAWEQTAGPPVTLINSTASQASFTIDATGGATLEFQLTVSDGSLSDSVLVAVSLSPPQIVSLKLDANNARDALLSTSPSTVFFPHTVTNTGNGPDTISLTATSQTGNSPVDIFADADTDGRPDSAVPTPISDTGRLPPGQPFAFLVATLTGNESWTVTATSGLDSSVTTSNTDTAVPSDAVLILTKDVDISSGTSSGPYTYTFTYANVGVVGVTGFEIIDPVPPGMTYVPGSGRWSITGTTPLTDAVDGPESIPASNDTINYAFDSTTGTGNVTAVINNVAVGQGGTLSFQVTLDSGLASGTTLLNSGFYRFNESTVCNRVPTTPPAPSCETNRSAFTVP
jgi:uncharacterized repeat protein (TIGR01451 family)